MKPRTGALFLSLAVCGLVVAAGCASKRDSSDSGKDSASTGAPVGFRAGETPFRIRGLLTIADSTSFRACGESNDRRVVDETHGDLDTVWREMAPEPGHAIFVEVIATDAADAVALGQPEGIRSARAIAIREVRCASLPGESSGCDEPWNTYEFRAHGNEPFWAVTITKQEIVFQEPGEPGKIGFPRVPVRTERRTKIFSTAVAGPPAHSLEVVLEEKRCRDGMATALFPLTARVTLDGRKLQGCAQEGEPER
jgi:uncharacterized membrane protein